MFLCRNIENYPLINPVTSGQDKGRILVFYTYLEGKYASKLISKHTIK